MLFKTSCSLCFIRISYHCSREHYCMNAASFKLQRIWNILIYMVNTVYIQYRYISYINVGTRSDGKITQYNPSGEMSTTYASKTCPSRTVSVPYGEVLSSSRRRQNVLLFSQQCVKCAGRTVMQNLSDLLGKCSSHS